MKVKIETITPEIAQKILDEQNPNNYRNLKPAVVAMYAKDMKEGKWIKNGDCIRFDQNGVLLDGQHRLRAIVESGIPQDFVIVEDVPSEGVKTIDIGHKRSIEDYLKRAESAYTANATSVVRQAIQFTRRMRCQGQSNANVGISNMEVVDEFSKHKEEYIDATKFGKDISVSSQRALKPAEVGALYYYLAYVFEGGCGTGCVASFFANIKGAAPAGDTIYSKTLNTLLKARDKVQRLSPVERITLYMQCWNAMVRGNTKRLATNSEWFEKPQ